MEENKLKVWIVEEQSVLDVDEEHNIHVFSIYEKAKDFFDKYVKEEKENDHLMDYDDKVIEESETHFAIWRDGYYCEDRFVIDIYEKEVF